MFCPRGADGPRIVTPAFAEVGHPAQVPGPLLRASAGTPIRITIHNTLDRPIAVRGLLDRATMAPVRRPPALALAVLPAFAFAEPLVIAPGDTSDVTFTPTQAVSSFYYATTLPPHAPPSAVAASAVPRLREGALMGALVVDPRGSPPPHGERVLMITRWNAPGESDTWKMMVNGESWPFTEHLQYAVGDTVRWRVINASDIDHPMHLHGFYFTVNALGDTQRDTLFTVDPPHVVTQMMQEFSAMRMSWVASRPGDWLFHCHLIQHIGQSQHLAAERIANADAHAHGAESDDDPMAGLIVGITIHPAPGTRVADEPPVRTIELWTGRRPNVYGDAPELVVRIWEENHQLHGTFPTPKAASGAARSGQLLRIGKDLLAVGRDLDGLAHLYGPQYRFSGSRKTLDHLDVEDEGHVLVRLTRVPDDAAPASGPHSTRRSRAGSVR